MFLLCCYDFNPLFFVNTLKLGMFLKALMIIFKTMASGEQEMKTIIDFGIVAKPICRFQVINSINEITCI